MTDDKAAGLAASSWRFEAAGSITAADSADAAHLEHVLSGQFASTLSDPRFGVVRSQFAGEHLAGTPGIPEPEPKPAVDTLSPEAQIDSLKEQLAEANAKLAALEERNLA